MPKNKHITGNLFTRQPLAISETSLSASIAQWLDAHRIYNDRLNSGRVCVKKGAREHWMHLCKTGTPDRFAIVRGHIVFIEVKKLNNKPSPEQLAKHSELRASGATVLVCDSLRSFIAQITPLL